MTAKDRDNIIKAISGISIAPETVPFKAVCTYYQKKPDSYQAAVAAMNKYLHKKKDWIHYENDDYQLSSEGIVLVMTKIITSDSLRAQVELLEKLFRPVQEDEEFSVQKKVAFGEYIVRVIGTSLKEATENPWFHGQDILKWLGYARIKDSDNCNVVPICTLPEETHKKVYLNGVQHHVVNAEGIRLLIKRRISDAKQQFKHDLFLAMKHLDDVQIFEEEPVPNEENFDDEHFDEETKAIVKSLLANEDTEYISNSMCKALKYLFHIYGKSMVKILLQHLDEDKGSD